MKKNVFILFFLSSLFSSLYSNEFSFKGYPTDVQVNDDKTFTLMINDDYEFSFYNVSFDGELKLEKLLDLTKKDVYDNTSELNELYNQKCVLDERMVLEIEKEKVRQQKQISKRRGFEVKISAYICFYEKTNNQTVCILNIEDGDYVYNSTVITIENDKVKIKKAKKGVVICCYKIKEKNNLIIYYNYGKDETYITIL